MSNRNNQKCHYKQGSVDKNTKSGMGEFTSGASSTYKRGPGAPPGKKKRKTGWAGLPMNSVPGKGPDWTQSTRLGSKNG